MNNADLALVKMIIDEPGFKIIENGIRMQVSGMDSTSRLIGDLFLAGELKGHVSGLRWVLRDIETLRAATMKIEEEE